MKGDFTRFTFDRRSHYSGVRQQQGRVTLDADWNEQLDIASYRTETECVDTVGASGMPMGQDGFRAVASAAALTAAEAARPVNAAPPALVGAGDFLITAGRGYVGGWLAENERITRYFAQPDLPGAPPPVAGIHIAYLDVWQRHISTLELPGLQVAEPALPDIREVALGGPDTATRQRTVWQVRLLRVGDNGAALDCTSVPASWTALTTPPSGRLAARAQPPAVPAGPCVLPADAGYRRLENQLYRVEVHVAGPRGTATFKWSRDNGTVAARWETQAGADITVSSAGRDKLLSFATGQWVELVDDARELRGERGTLVQLSAVDGNRLTLDLPTAGADPTTMASFDANARVRQWDSAATLRPTNDGWLDLEDGVQVRMTAGDYRSGDHWVIPARTAIADIEWPRIGAVPAELAPRGTHHRHARLAMMHFDGAAWTQIDDCRQLFPPLTELASLFYLGGDGQEALPAAVLDAPLRVGVANGTQPVAGARVRFTRTTVAGSLQAAVGAVEEPGASATSRIVLTDAQGEAEVRFQLGPPNAAVTHEVLAEWLDAGGTLRHLPIRFFARASVAAQIWYDNNGCPALAGATTVQQALGTLADQAIIRMLGGDAQPIQPTAPLTSACEVAVISACGPVSGARVRFEPQGAGRAAATLAGLPASAGAVDLLTDANGRAAAFWQPDPDPAPNVQLMRALLVNAGTRRIQAPGEVVFMALRGAERCHNFLDELRSDGVVRDLVTQVLGLRVSFDPGNGLRVFFTAGVAYVAGCRWRINAGSVNLAAVASPQLVYVDMDGQMRVGGTLPRALARLAEVYVEGGNVLHVVDVRRDLTHLDDRVDLVEQNAAQRRIDRRVGIPLLASTLPDVTARDLRSHEASAAGVFGLAFDGQDMWAASQLGGVFRLAGRGALNVPGAVTPLVLGTPVFGAAYDGVAHVWFSGANADRVFAINKNTLRVTSLASAGTPFPLALGAGMMWVGNFAAGTVSAFDVGTLQLRFTVNLVAASGAAPQALAFDGTAMWVGCSNGRLHRISTQGLIEASLSFNDIGIRALAFDGAALWLVTGQLFGSTGQVDRIDVLTGQRPPGPAPFSGDEVLCDGSLMWVYDTVQSDAAGFQAGLVRRDCATGSPQGTMTINQRLSGWAFDGTHIWAALRANNAPIDTVRVRKILVV